MIEVIRALVFLLDIYQLLILIVVLMSWINPDPYNPIVRFLRQATDPVLLPFRKLLMPLTTQIRIDLSPILVFLLIGMLQRMLIRVAYGGLTLGAVGSGLLEGAVEFVMAVLMFLVILMGARAIVEFTNADRWNPIVRFIETVTDPVVFRFRNFRGRSSRYNLAPVAAGATFLVAYFVVRTLRQLLLG